MQDKCFYCFRTISCQNRFKIFQYLQKKPRSTISKLVKLTGLRQPTVTFHINALCEEGLVKKSKAGRNVLCQTCQKCDNCPLFK